MNTVPFVNSYQATLIMCGLLILIMGVTMSRAIGGLHEIRYFRTLTWSAICIAVGESIWNLNHMPTIQLSGAFMRFLSFLNLSASAIGPMCLYSFSWAAVSRMGILKETKGHACGKHVPAFCMIVLNGISYWKGYTYSVDGDGFFVAGPVYGLQLLVCLGYLTATGILVLYADRKTRHVYRRDLMRLAKAAGIVLLGGIGQTVITGAPIVSICNALGMTYLNVSLLQANVTTDALTGLTNRSKMNSVLQEKFENAQLRPFTLYIADVNSFKKINDTYGHQEGDEALKRVANVLRQLEKQYRSMFAARYGGDEFLMTIDLREHVAQEQLEQEIQELLDQEQKEAGADYRITMCLGGYRVNSRQDAHAYAIRVADDMMYHKKQMLHSHENREKEAEAR